MPDINQINGLVLCDEIHVNGVTIANIKNIDGITKDCCTANGPISLAKSEDNCEAACASESCSNYYTNGASGTCPLVNGNYLYVNTSCVLASDGYYSPNNCGGCSKCYTVSSGVITVSDCPSDCRTITLASSSESCTYACLERCVTWYTDTAEGESPAVGNHIYPTAECTCPEEGNKPYYSDKCGTRSGICYTINTSTCAITELSSCR